MSVTWLWQLEYRLLGIINHKKWGKSRSHEDNIERAVQRTPRRPWPEILMSIQIWGPHSRTVTISTCHWTHQGYGILLWKPEPNKIQSCSFVLMLLMFASHLEQESWTSVTEITGHQVANTICPYVEKSCCWLSYDVFKS